MVRVAKVMRCGAFALAAFALPKGSIAATGQLTRDAHAGSRIPTQPQAFEQDKAQKILRGYAACIVKRQRSLSAEYVLDRSTLRFDHKYDPLADGVCLVEATGSNFDEVGLKLSEDAMRFALAEALLRDELGTIDPERLPKAVPLRLPFLRAADYEPEMGKQYRPDELKTFDEKRARDQVTVIMYRFGECAVRSDPRSARALLLTAPDSDAERATLQPLMPVLGNCLAKGAQVTLNRTKLRGAIGMSYYALAHAPLAATATAQH